VVTLCDFPAESSARWSQEASLATSIGKVLFQPGVLYMGTVSPGKFPDLFAPTDPGRPLRRPPGSTSRGTVERFVEANVAAEFLHYSSRSIKQMAREGRIPAHPFGTGTRKRWYFLISELAEHLHAQVNSAYGEAGRDKTQRRVI